MKSQHFRNNRIVRKAKYQINFEEFHTMNRIQQSKMTSL